MRKQVYFAYILCLFGFLLSLYLFYPGYMSPDTISQLTQAETFTFNNWHPPVMALFWRFLILSFPGVQPLVPMLVFQLALLWLALFVFVYVVSTRTQKYLWLIPLIGLFPSVFIFNGVLWKDIQMGNALLLVFALLLLVPRVKNLYIKYGLFFIIVGVSFYAFCLRHEAVFASLPLFYLFVLSMPFLKGQVGRILVFLVLLFAFFGLRGFMESAIHTVNTYPAQQLMFYDLASMSIAENKMLVPEDNCTVQDCFSVLQSHYQRELVDSLINGVPFNKISNKAQYQELQQAWFGAIVAQPLVYLHERLEFFYGLLIYTPVAYPKHYEIESPGPYHVSMPKPWFTQFVSTYQVVNFPFNLLFWILLSGLCLFLLKTGRKSMSYWDYLVCRSSLFSGLLLWMSHFIVASAPDFRYYYWTMLSGFMSFIFIVLNLNLLGKDQHE